MDQSDSATAGTENQLQNGLFGVRQLVNEQVTKLRHEADVLADKVQDNSSRISSLDRKIEQEKLEGEIEEMKGEFRIVGYKWTLPDLGRPGSSARRKFLGNLVRKVFTNQELIDAEVANTTPIVDLRPQGWKDGNPLIIKFGDHMIYHGIKERLPKLARNPAMIKVRANKPIILENMHNELLKTRRSLLDADPSRTIFIEEKNFPPYLTLVEKKTRNGTLSRTPLSIEWSDERFQDPVMFHYEYAREFRQTAAGRRNDSRGNARGSARGNARGSARGRGTPRGGARSRGPAPNTRSHSQSQ